MPKSYRQFMAEIIKTPTELRMRIKHHEKQAGAWGMAAAFSNDPWRAKAHIRKHDQHLRAAKIARTLLGTKSKMALKEGRRENEMERQAAHGTRKRKPGLTSFDKMRIDIARKTLRMPDPMLGVMGGMTKKRAKEILKLKESGPAYEKGMDDRKPIVVHYITTQGKQGKKRFRNYAHYEKDVDSGKFVHQATHIHGLNEAVELQEHPLDANIDQVKRMRDYTFVHLKHLTSKIKDMSKRRDEQNELSAKKRSKPKQTKKEMPMSSTGGTTIHIHNGAKK